MGTEFGERRDIVERGGTEGGRRNGWVGRVCFGINEGIK